jgi:hypothetical protein
MKDVVHLSHVELQLIGQKLKTIARQFNDILFSYIYREQNMEVDSMSKEALLLHTNLAYWEEFLDGFLVSRSEETFF